jgi:hypothetical protein
MKCIKILFAISILLLFFSSCSITKRHYLQGYSIEWSKNNFSGNCNSLKKCEPKFDFLTNEKSSDSISSYSIKKPDEMPVIASIGIPESFKKFSPRHLNLKYNINKSLDGCDVITLKNNSEINAKVLEINQTEIKYKKCDDVNGPTITVAKQDVNQIKYSNGTVDLINSLNQKALEYDYYSPSTKIENSNSSTEPIINKHALASMILAILSILLFPLVPLPIIFGIIALKQIQKNPERYKGKWMAIFGLVLGGIMVLAIIAFILLFFIFLLMI